MRLPYGISFTLKDNLRFRIVLVLCSVLFIVYRAPYLLLYPRLWAEEGKLFYEFALHHSTWDIFTTVHVGYITLFNNIVSALQAKVFLAESAATVSTYIGFLVQLVPVYVITFTSNKFWDTPFKKILCTFIVIVVMVPELWLNTTNSHFVFGLVTFLIMIISTPQLSLIQKHLFRLFLFIGGLSGPASIIFTPVFLLKAYLEKSKEKYIQAGIISVCAITQVVVILYAILFHTNAYTRLSNYDLEKTILAFFIDNFTLNIYVRVFTNLFQSNFYFGVSMAIFFIYLFIKNRKNNEYLIALLSFVIISVFQLWVL